MVSHPHRRLLTTPLFFTENEDDPLCKINLPRFPSLRHLNIFKCQVWHHSILGLPIPSFPSSICQLLNLRGSTSDIQTMYISVTYGGVEPGTERQILHPSLGWADFDTILADENYRALKLIKLEFEIEFTRWHHTPRSGLFEIKSLVDGLFPAVNASGRVRMDIDVMLS